MTGNRRLTVPGVLALLATAIVLGAVLTPATLGARAQSGRPICVTNMKQLAMALAMYVQDSAGYLPHVETVATSNMPAEPARGELFCGHETIASESQADYVKRCAMRNRLQPYLSSTEVWRCPCDPDCDPRCVTGMRWSSYHYRLYIGDAPYVPYPKTYYNISDFKCPADNYIFSEVEPFHDGRTAPLPWLDGAAGWDPAARMNFGFLDWHVRPVEIGRILLKWRTGGPPGWEMHWPRNAATGVQSPWESEVRDIASK